MDITFWTTMDCNLNCAYCYNRANNNIKKEYMLRDTAKKAIELFRKIEHFGGDDLYINFHGGEPLLNCEVIESIMNELEQNIPRDRIIYGITTNGTIQTDIAKQILKKIDNISVSIDGNKENHNKYRVYSDGRGSFDNDISFAKELQKRKNIRVRMTVTRQTLPNMKETIAFLIDEGFKEIVPILDMYDSRWKEDDEQAVMTEFKKIKEYLDDNNLKNIVVGQVTKMPFTLKGICSGGIDGFHVLPTGDIYPCSMVVGDEEWKIGDVEKGLDSEKIKLIQTINMQKVKSCQGCNFYNYCEGPRCKLVNKKITGNFFEASAIMCLQSRVALKMMNYL